MDPKAPIHSLQEPHTQHGSPQELNNERQQPVHTSPSNVQTEDHLPLPQPQKSDQTSTRSLASLKTATCKQHPNHPAERHICPPLSSFSTSTTTPDLGDQQSSDVSTVDLRKTQPTRQASVMAQEASQSPPFATDITTDMAQEASQVSPFTSGMAEQDTFQPTPQASVMTQEVPQSSLFATEIATDMAQEASQASPFTAVSSAQPGTIQQIPQASAMAQEAPQSSPFATGMTRVSQASPFTTLLAQHDIFQLMPTAAGMTQQGAFQPMPTAAVMMPHHGFMQPAPTSTAMARPYAFQYLPTASAVAQYEASQHTPAAAMMVDETSQQKFALSNTSNAPMGMSVQGSNISGRNGELTNYGPNFTNYDLYNNELEYLLSNNGMQTYDASMNHGGSNLLNHLELLPETSIMTGLVQPSTEQVEHQTWSNHPEEYQPGGYQYQDQPEQQQVQGPNFELNSNFVSEVTAASGPIPQSQDIVIPDQFQNGINAAEAPSNGRVPVAIGDKPVYRDGGWWRRYTPSPAEADGTNVQIQDNLDRTPSQDASFGSVEAPDSQQPGPKTRSRARANSEAIMGEPRLCTECGKRFRKSKSLTMCQRCDDKYQRSTATPHVFPLDPSITNLEDATKKIYPPAPAHSIAGDDYEEQVRETSEDEFVQMFLDAINTVQTNGPGQDTWEARQQKTFNEKARMEACYSDADVTARVRALYAEVVNFHAGTRASLYPVGGDNAGYSINTRLVFSERISLICTVLELDKRIVMDVVEGRGVQGLVCNPQKYHERKTSNNNCNDKKKKIMEMGKSLEEDEDEGGDDLQKGPTRGRKRKRRTKTATAQSSTTAAQASTTAEQSSSSVEQPSSVPALASSDVRYLLTNPTAVSTPQEAAPMMPPPRKRHRQSTLLPGPSGAAAYGEVASTEASPQAPEFGLRYAPVYGPGRQATLDWLNNNAEVEIEDEFGDELEDEIEDS